MRRSGSAWTAYSTGSRPSWSGPTESGPDLSACVAYRSMTGSRFQTLAAELRERIALGDYARSGALDSEAELGRRYAVSRVTVRRALEQLRGGGVVAARRGTRWGVGSRGAFWEPPGLGRFQHARPA